MKICVLQPDYSVSSVAHGEFDPPRDLACLLPEDEVVHVFLRKADVHAQLRALRRDRFDIFVNLCEGYLDWDIPSIDVIDALTRLGLPFTGPTAEHYDPSKIEMKICATHAGVSTPACMVVNVLDDPLTELVALDFPVFVKPVHAGDSLGIDEASLCFDMRQLQRKVQSLLSEYDDVLIERYLPGREFSVLVLGERGQAGCGRALVPNEFICTPATPFKTYDLKARSYLPERNVACLEEPLSQDLRNAAEKIFASFAAVGYCRMDFRLDESGAINFIDANFACSVLYPSGYYGTADYILAHDGLGQSGFLRHIIQEGLCRYELRKPPFRVSMLSGGGFCLQSTRALAAGEIVLRVQEQVRRGTLECLLSQDHGCDANLVLMGRDVAALRSIALGESLYLNWNRAK